MKKIGIITFHRALNYGALLQAFALKTAFGEIGRDAAVVDYRNDMLENIYEYPGFFHQAGIANKLRYLLYSRMEHRKIRRFEEFRNHYLLSDDSVVYDKSNIDDANQCFSHFFTGSDQVWNPDAHGMDGTYFLDFVQNASRKHTYAVSFGVSELKDSYKRDYFDLIQDFGKISVRESQGLDILEGLGIKEGHVDPDPVFLLTSDEWRKFLGVSSKNEKYAFIYNFSLTDNQIAMARLCHEAGMKIYMVGHSLKNPFGFPCTMLGDLGPREFIEYISNASFVITNSFHGTALSIVFNRPFAMEYLTGNSVKVNSRLQNVIQFAGLENQVISVGKDLASIMENDIDWNSTNRKIEDARERAFEYLESCINE